MDPIFALKVTMEGYRSKNTPLHLLFLDMQKACDCVPRDVIWWALRSKGVPETYVVIIRDMYRDSGSVVRSAVGDPTVMGNHHRRSSPGSLVRFCSAWCWTCCPPTSGTHMSSRHVCSCMQTTSRWRTRTVGAWFDV
ncbi:hypothetical protein PYW08_016787 [Mythimna loreyi]|uniref:Uncharacterized protein n=1 Tax=Mythimna loreyi TaxID=667449 RepID=A0ACC2R0D7_9NEOP|nr:hypothetical protein PYW08_016787 [Mythimna loreyi]